MQRKYLCGALACGAVQPPEYRRCLLRRAAPLRDSHVGTAGGTALWRGELYRVAKATEVWTYPRHRPTPMAVLRRRYRKYNMPAPTQLARLQ